MLAVFEQGKYHPLLTKTFLELNHQAEHILRTPTKTLPKDICIYPIPLTGEHFSSNSISFREFMEQDLTTLLERLGRPRRLV
jgi:hypothetical protein